MDAALDNANVSTVASYIREHATDEFQFIVISLKQLLYEKAQSLVGIYRDQGFNSSKTMTLMVLLLSYVKKAELTLFCIVGSISKLMNNNKKIPILT